MASAYWNGTRRGRVRDKTDSSAIAAGSKEIVATIVWVDAEGFYSQATDIAVTIPTARTDQNSHLYDDAEKMKNPKGMVAFAERRRKKVGRNEPCWCGSKIKFKHCHGR